MRTAGSRVGRNQYPGILLDLYAEGWLAADVAPMIVPDAWCSAEFPLRQLDRDLWRELFALAGYTHNFRPAARPTSALTLYRGAVAERRTDWSWTPTRSVAERFTVLRASEGQTRLWTAQVEPSHLLAYIGEDGRAEDEFVVDTDGVVITEVSTKP